ncbi:MAG: argininosuccinate lyase [Clostridia bacterium]|nr:argininosuccinate lyase [Clostridia bacterium]
MEKLWAGRAAKQLDQLADDFNSSIHFDQRMFEEDLTGSMAHAAMLGAKGINSPEDTEAILAGLESILADLKSGALEIDPAAEDIHMFNEAELTRRIGDAGKRLHTARSRNDQVALDLRLWLRKEIANIRALTAELIRAICDKAQDSRDAIVPGYTHLQRAQPIVFAHHLLAYGMMLERDLGRLSDAAKRVNISPLGSGALAGTTYPIDREMTAKALGMDGYTLNSIDGVSDRDFVAETCSALALLMMHLSRLSEELILWCSWEFRYVELDDAYTTGSSIMPQKKNADMAELIRGKTGRVYGNLMGILTVLKGLPLAYNKDMQEDKEGLFDSVDTAKMCLQVMTPMIATMTINRESMRNAAAKGFINATDLADYLVRKGLPFRSAYKIVGQIVAECTNKGLVLETLPLEAYQAHSELFTKDLFDAISLETCVSQRTSPGSVSAPSLDAQFAFLANAVEGL